MTADGTQHAEGQNNTGTARRSEFARAVKWILLTLAIVAGLALVAYLGLFLSLMAGGGF